MYTVGIKHRFWFGYRKVLVEGHGFADGRLILNLVDGSQEVYPGAAVSPLKVYNDFQDHYRELEYRAQLQKEIAEKELLDKEREEKLLEMKAAEKAQEILRQREAPRVEQGFVSLPQISAEKVEEQNSNFEREVENEVLRRATKRLNDLYS